MVKEFVLIEHGEYTRLKENPTSHENEIIEHLTLISIHQ